MDFPENKHVIDKYVENNSCEVGKHPVILQGKLHELIVYTLPIDHLYYNIINGRFKSEYVDLVQKNGGKELNSKNSEDAKKIHEMLLSLDLNETRRTKKDILSIGQHTAGIITEDGFVIDGNRRLAILTELSKNDTKFKLMRVARLPSGIRSNDLWKIEAGIQLGKEQIQRYGPINEMLKLQEGIDAGLTTQEIADTLYGYDDDKEIVKKLARLKLIENYLKFIGAPKQYKFAKNSVEHFIDLQSILEQAQKTIDDPELKKNIKIAVFGLIQEKQPHRDLRHIKKMIQNDSTRALEEISKIAALSKPSAIPPDKILKPKQQIIDSEVDSAIENEDEDEDESTPRRTIFSNAVDVLKADENKDDVSRLLTRALTNLDAVDYSDEALSTQNSKEKINLILRHAEKLRAKLDD